MTVTRKQKKAFESLSENIGKPMGQILREAGYSQSVSETPQRVTETKGWQELMDKYLPDEMLTTIGLRALSATKRDQFTGEETDDWASIYRFWSEWMDRKHPKVTKSELTGKDGQPLIPPIPLMDPSELKRHALRQDNSDQESQSASKTS